MKWKGTFAAVMLAGSMAVAAVPPELVGFQGVLRDSLDQPLDGTYDIVFAFYDAETFGNEVLLDAHSGANAVLITGGLFNVPMGSGVLSDGSGPGSYLTLAALFRDYGAVWLEVRVGGETLAPRMRVAAAAYALNSTSLAGRAASEFLDTSSTAQTKTGPLVADATGIANSNGVQGVGVLSGGYFEDADGTSTARLGYGNFGVDGRGISSGGIFRDSNGSGIARVGFGDTGIEGEGSEAGGRFYGDFGIKGYGSGTGGYFEDTDSSATCFTAVHNIGVDARGSQAGGYFADSDSSGWAYVGYADEGIAAHGTVQGGYFHDDDNLSFAHVAYGDYGIHASGNEAGGYFEDTDGIGYAHVGYSNRGIDARGSAAGGIFVDWDSSGTAYVAYGDIGVEARGDESGGYFFESNGSGQAWLGDDDWGVIGFGYQGGGYFNDTDSSAYAHVGSGTDKILGSGAVSFVQNHPENPGRVVVYHAPEASEVNTYTRGTARLERGEARIALDPTFAWVTNPDLGLTAHLTPRGEAVPLAVGSLTTSELVVKGLDDTEITFDYLVFGLRIGFEESSPVREKTEESRIPSMASHRERYEKFPELRAFNALSRYEEMDRAVHGETATRAGADDLVAAIEEYDPVLHGPVDRTRTRTTDVANHADRATADEASSRTTTEVLHVFQAPTLPVSERIDAGDVLVNDPLLPGVVRRCEAVADRAVIGLADGQDGESWWEHAPVATSGVVHAKVDASYAAVSANDLLVTSPTPGHAMRAPEGAAAGTILGKALEPLETGTGRILVLITPR